MRLLKLIEEIEGIRFGNSLALEDIQITGICPDSSRVAIGNLYIAIEGLKSDGHEYICDAIGRGAAAVAVSERALKEKIIDAEGLSVPIIVCEDTRAFASYAFSAFCDHPQRKMKMIGVTGTNGKTSVSRLIFEILRRSGVPCGIIGTTGSFTHKSQIDIKSKNKLANMTTPEPEELYPILLEMEKLGCSVVIMEVTSHALFQKRVEPISFYASVFTNLSEDHLDFHENMENYFATKASLFKKSGLAVINYDDRYGRRLADMIDIPALLCSAEGREVSCYAEDIRLSGKKGIEYKLSSPNMRLRVRSPLKGAFNVMNTMQAAIVAYALGASALDIKTTLDRFFGVSGRLERLKLDASADFSVYVDYAHTPDALENLIRAAKSFAVGEQRIVLLFGCGGDRDKGKRPHMGKIATALADFVVITSDNSRSEDPKDIISDILAGISNSDGAPYTVIEDRRSAIDYVIKNARQGDIILLAGKGHEEYEIDSLGIRPFSEREIVNEFVKKYYGR